MPVSCEAWSGQAGCCDIVGSARLKALATGQSVESPDGVCARRLLLIVYKKVGGFLGYVDGGRMNEAFFACVALRSGFLAPWILWQTLVASGEGGEKEREPADCGSDGGGGGGIGGGGGV